MQRQRTFLQHSVSRPLQPRPPAQHRRAIAVCRANDGIARQDEKPRLAVNDYFLNSGRRIATTSRPAITPLQRVQTPLLVRLGTQTTAARCK